MKWLESVGTMLKAVTWPVVAMLALILLSRPLGRLLDRLKNFTIKDGTVTVELFAERVKKLAGEVKEQAEKAARQAKKTGTSKGLSMESAAGMPARVPDESWLLQLATESPWSAIVEAWKLVESSVDRAGAPRGLPAESGRSPSSAEPVPSVQSKGTLDEETLSIVDSLHSLRNQAVHSPDYSVDPVSAREYVELAITLVQRIREKTQETPQSH